MKSFPNNPSSRIRRTAASASAGGVPAQAVAASAAPSVATQCATLAAQIAYYSVIDPAKAEILRSEFSGGTCDPMWAECLAVYDNYQLSNQPQPYINFTSIDDFVIENCFPENASIAVI